MVQFICLIDLWGQWPTDNLLEWSGSMWEHPIGFLCPVVFTTAFKKPHQLTLKITRVMTQVMTNPIVIFLICTLIVVCWFKLYHLLWASALLHCPFLCPFLGLPHVLHTCAFLVRLVLHGCNNFFNVYICLSVKQICLFIHTIICRWCKVSNFRLWKCMCTEKVQIRFKLQIYSIFVKLWILLYFNETYSTA